MKLYTFLILIGAFGLLFGCNKFKSDHPQTEIIDQHATDLTAKSILQFAAITDKNISKYIKKTSLLYMLGELSFYVENYSENGQTVLLIEHVYNGANSKSLKKYYFKNDSLILATTKSELTNDEGSIFKDERFYLRSNTAFRIENRKASAGGEINALAFIDSPLSDHKTTDRTLLNNVKTLNDVINRNEKFNVVFESITTYPDSRYIVLRSKDRNSYSASVLVRERDTFIDSLLNNPILFKDEKLNFKWIIKGREAIYVPVVNNTSANGLNR